MKLELKTESLLGSVGLVAVNAQGVERHSPVFENDILNSLLVKALGVGMMRNTNGMLCVGSGSAPNSAATVGMEIPLAREAQCINVDKTVTFDAATRELTITSVHKYQFDMGEVVGNVTEVGVLFSSYSNEYKTDTRVVIDAFPVKADEQLFALYTFVGKITLPPATQTLTYKYNGVDTTTTMECTVAQKDDWVIQDVLQHLLQMNQVKSSRHRLAEIDYAIQPEERPTATWSVTGNVKTVNLLWDIHTPSYYVGDPESLATIQFGVTGMLVMNFDPPLPKSEVEVLNLVVSQDLGAITPFA